MRREELFDEVDEDGNVIATHPKSYFKERMFLHNVSLIIPISTDNKILISRRAKDKYPYPDTWTCCLGGKANSGENSEDAAKREMREEAGKDYNLKKVTTFVYNKSDYRAIFSIFTTTVPVVPNDLNLDPEETRFSKAFTTDEIMKMISSNPKEFAPTFVAAIKEFIKHRN